ncbi:hypothetical protein BMW23_0275 [Bodo saltans virus]|uniref:Uncharacterized protein n=1 Tax=Bodo saltans virus TaxID=2024608 RepID=A0A2H4UTQ8_9VIRU|nr:hypothetical protein QJ851_gp0270 [Bodo saltans virus]ATZ80333.1 hypothetical protein BMW23_0275 [Bodo saltans virus]
MYNYVIIISLIIGIVCIIIGIIKTKKTNRRIIYRYIPRSFEEEQDEPIYASDIYKAINSVKTPWIYSVANIDIAKKEVSL